eukprot:GFUD01089812.1.p1 GENE.GFUD01089812.1~~GFUD01089812.1.p1  ORF type:complete len:176 (+),score=36.70 GFUD01089812.1:152-679(+)
MERTHLGAENPTGFPPPNMTYESSEEALGEEMDDVFRELNTAELMGSDVCGEVDTNRNFMIAWDMMGYPKDAEDNTGKVPQQQEETGDVQVSSEMFNGTKLCQLNLVPIHDKSCNLADQGRRNIFRIKAFFMSACSKDFLSQSFIKFQSSALETLLITHFGTNWLTVQIQYFLVK